MLDDVRRLPLEVPRVRFLKPSFALVFILSLFPVAGAAFQASALTETGSIKGSLLDASGAVIPAVAVTLTNGSGTAQETTADEKGEFSFAGLAPGIYTVSVTLQGFEPFKSANIDLKAGESARVDIRLVPANVATKVNVEGENATQVETETAQLSGMLNSKELTTYGLNGRNVISLINLTPGVSNQTGQDEALVGVKGSVKYSINGGRVEYNTYDVDGGDVLNASINGNASTLIVFPSVDSVREMQVLTSNYGAMYGRSASGTILIETKTGGPEFHGDAYFFLRNNHLNARNFFDETKRAPLYQKYDEGFTLGGPIYIPNHYNTNKDKSFFFVSEEWRHEREPVQFNQAVPSAAERDCHNAAVVQDACLNPFVPGVYGDFSDVCPAVGTASFVRTPLGASLTHLPLFPDCPAPFPAGTSVKGAGIYQPYPSNLVPINVISQTLLNTGMISAPDSTTGCNSTATPKACYNASISPLTTWHEDLFRIDHNFSLREKIYFRFIHDDWSTVVPTPEWGFIQNSVPSIQNDFVGPGLSTVAHLTSTITNSFVNDLAMAYTHDHITLKNIAGPGLNELTRDPALDNQPCPGACPIGFIFNNGFGNKNPGIVLGGTNAAYGGTGLAADPSYMPWKHSNPTYSPRDDASFTVRNHNVQFGVLAIIAQRNEINPPVGANTGDLQGILYFSNTNYYNTTGNAFADFLGGRVKAFQQDSAQYTYHNNYHIVEPYVQDNWKVKSYLTLNLGIRFSLFGQYEEKYKNAYNWVPSQFDTTLASQLLVDPMHSNLVLNGQPLPFDVKNLSPYLTNGIVRCGVDKYKDGTPVPTSCMKGKLFNPAPRIGLAWDPFKDGKTSVRAGYGIFFEHGTGNEANTGSLEGSVANAPAGVLDMTQNFPNLYACIGGNTAICNQFQGAYPLNLTSIPTKVTWPYVQQWSFSIQRNLPWNMLGTAAYVGSKGTHLVADLQINQLIPVNGSQNPFQPGQPLTGDICSFQGAGFFPINGVNIMPGQPGYVNLEAACNGLGTPLVIPPDPNSLRTPPYAIANGVGQIFSLQNVANSTYNSLQLSLRRVLGPLAFGVFYTYSHSVDDSSDRFSSLIVNAYDLSSNRASSDFDQRHLLNISYIYQVPSLRVKHFFHLFDDDPTNEVANKQGNYWSEGTLGRALFDNWEVSGITVYQTGTPFSVLNGGSPDVASSDNAGVASGALYGSYPDVNTNKNQLYLPGGSGQMSAFGPLLGNPSQFVAPTGLTYGNTGRNYLNNPSRVNFDMTLTKNWALNERYSFQFRIEAFNIFNHTQFRIYNPSRTGNPGNNVINCYGGAAVDPSDTSYSAGDASCLQTSSFLHPIDAHRPRTMQLGVKFNF